MSIDVRTSEFSNWEFNHMCQVVVSEVVVVAVVVVAVLVGWAGLVDMVAVIVECVVEVTTVINDDNYYSPAMTVVVVLIWEVIC